MGLECYIEDFTPRYQGLLNIENKLGPMFNESTRSSCQVCGVIVSYILHTYVCNDLMYGTCGKNRCSAPRPTILRNDFRIFLIGAAWTLISQCQ